VREYLEAFADPRGARDEALRSLQALADRVESGSGGRRIRRDELYER
jgi:hypothetical protein